MEASALPRRPASVLPRSRRLLAAFSDERLVEQVRRGNEAAFEVVFDRHHRAILSFCRHMLGSQEEAEDAVQQTFASAFSALRADTRDIRLKAWLYAIARNKSLSILRARREQPVELDERAATAGLSEEVQQRADLRELLADLRTLPDEQREALVLFELGDLSHTEIAEVIGVEPMKVKALVFQARSALIENREARAIPCGEIRERLATASGGELRRGPLRRHLKSCEGCAEYRDMVKKQRRAMAVLLPVIPTAGLKAGVLGALGIGGGAGGAGVTTAAGGTLAGGGVAAGGGAAAAGGFASMGAAKLAVGAIIATGAVAGGGFAVERVIHNDGPKPPASSEAAADPGSSGGATSTPAEPTSGTTIANPGGSGNEPSGGGAGSGSGDSGDKGSGQGDDNGDTGERESDGKKNGRRGGSSDGRRNEGRGSDQESGDDKGAPGTRGNGDDDDDGSDDNRGHGNDDDGKDEDNPGRGGDNSGSGNGNGRGDDKKDDGKNGQQAAPPPAPAPPPVADTDDTDDDDDGKKDDKDRLSVITQLGEATARP